MLPKKLSENLCSLKEKVDRLTLSVQMTLDKEGELIDYKIFRSIIHSKKRFTYEEAKEVLDGKQESPFKGSLLLMKELCEVLQKKRTLRGSIPITLPDYFINVDELGEPIKVDFVPYDETHQLVEEFMLKANEVIATHLCQKNLPIAYRVHEEPTVENMNLFVQRANAFGFQLKPNPTPQDLQSFFEKALKTKYGTTLSMYYVRSLQLAIYSPENIGHYGLALTHYCHFTSPIRRYADLIIHRSLFGKTLDVEAAKEISRHCSEQERISQKAENSVELIKKLRLLKRLHHEDKDKHYSAIITRVRPFGLVFEIPTLMLEGFIHVSEIGKDFYRYIESEETLKGERHNKCFKVGTKITVSLLKVDLITQESLWELIN